MKKDKILHFGACALISTIVSTALAALAAPFPAAAFGGLSAAMAAGIAKEYADSTMAGNRWDWQDILADTIGAIIGASLGALPALI